MKKFGFFAAALGSAALMLTSCLGETTNSQSVVNVPGLIEIDGASSTGYHTLINVGDLRIYSSLLDNKGLTTGDCVITSFEVDYSSDENANAAAVGYYNATVSTCDKVDKYNLESLTLPADTAALLENEVAVDGAVNAFYMQSYLKGYQFLWSNITLKEDQDVAWHIYADMHNLEPIAQENGINTYALFLRAVQTREPSDDTTSKVLTCNAFFTKNYMDAINSREKNEGNNYYLTRVYYVKSIDSKTNKPVWDYDTVQTPVSQH